MPDEVTPADVLKVVGSDEVLHRRLLFDANAYVQDNGRWRLTSQAFAERSGLPSVDRRLLRQDPRATQGDEKNAVVRVAVAEVRAIADVREMGGKRGEIVEQQYSVDVHPDPLPDNDSHAEIRPAPAYRKPRLKEKLEKALQRIVNDSPDPWVIPVWETRRTGTDG